MATIAAAGTLFAAMVGTGVLGAVDANIGGSFSTDTAHKCQCGCHCLGRTGVRAGGA